MRNGKKAVVLGEIPETPLSSAKLVGHYYALGIGNLQVMWCKDGRKWSDRDEDGLDLVPNKRKIERWGFLAVRKSDKASMSVDRCTESIAEYIKKDMEKELWICSEVFKYPVVEVEE